MPSLVLGAHSSRNLVTQRAPVTKSQEKFTTFFKKSSSGSQDKQIPAKKVEYPSA